MAIRLRRPKDEETGARIEIVPLIDIMFFLLATFILATLGMTQSQALAPVRLPPSAAATASAEYPSPASSSLVSAPSCGGSRCPPRR